jgi:HemY protein
VSVVWQGYRIDSSFALLVAAVVASAILIALTYEIYRWLIISPRRLRARGLERKRRRGYRALTRGLVSAAAGDGGGARKAARVAEGLLGEPPLTLLLTAQAAQLDGDEAAAGAAFREMLTHEETEFLGLRGLLVQAVRKGDTATALALARRAYEISPDAGWVLSNLIELESSDGNWEGAEKAVDSAVRARRLSQPEGLRKRALFGYQKALAARQSGDDRKALDFARQALAKQPDFVPAAVLTAELQIEAGQRREARRLAARTWSSAPHPDLARVYIEASLPDGALEKVKALEPLVKARPEAPEGHLAIAAAALEAKLWGTARSHLDRLTGDAGTAQLYRLRAMLEEAEHGDGAAAREWWRRASAAPPDPAWVCERCGTPSLKWQLLCPSCGAVDNQSWCTPPIAMDDEAPVAAIAGRGAIVVPDATE